jgi:hypothetical protein
MPKEPPSKVVLLELLTEADRQQRNAEIEVRRLVVEARRTGAVWEDIGRALGTTKQGAQKRFGGAGELICAVCKTPLTSPKIRLEGVTASSDDPHRPWLWGPVMVHDPCRLELQTPWDDVVGDFMRTYEMVDRDSEIPVPVFSEPDEN